jgi:myo-inositol-1-phosphate synthase
MLKRMEGRMFGDVSMNLELRLRVEDSPNSALALGRKIGDPLTSISAYTMPPMQFLDRKAKDMVEEFT